VGDKIIIASYAALAEDEIGFFTPKIVVLDDGNRIKELR
jgi:aspartate 1-decarboxylase